LKAVGAQVLQSATGEQFYTLWYNGAYIDTCSHAASAYPTDAVLCPLANFDALIADHARHDGLCAATGT
jgi:hypothetical protein